jgi:hypothetical protein
MDFEKQFKNIKKQQKNLDRLANSSLGTAQELLNNCDNPLLKTLCQDVLNDAHNGKVPNVEDFIKQANKLKDAS